MSIERELQQKMDVEKWLESETRHFDMCGSYDYCAFCDKSEETPCANAYLRMTAQDAQEAEPEPSYDYPVEGDTEEVLGRHIDPEIIMKKKAARKSLSFVEKYSLQTDIVKERYAALRAALTAVKGRAPYQGTHKPPVRHLPQKRRHSGENHHNRQVAPHKSAP